MRREIHEARAEGDIDYDKLMALPLMDAVVRETLRLWVSVHL